MTSNLWTGKHACLISIAILLLAAFCLGQPAVSLSPKDGPPTTKLQVSGSGFTPYAQIDIYFDSQDKALAVADGTGAFSKIAIQVPASAVPGNHWVSTVERGGGHAKQEIFNVQVNWTEFHTKDMMRWNPYENILNVNNVGNLKKLGSYATGSYVWSSPAVVNGVVYFGSDDNNVYALNASTGALLWSFQTGGGVSSPAVANGVVYVGSEDYNVYALSASTGAPLWTFATGLWVQSSPAVANGMVYIGSYDHNVYALNATTGALQWKFATGGEVNWSSPAVANGVVYIGSEDNNVYALNASTGALLWSYATGNWVDSSPAVANGVVYVGSEGYNLYALNAKTGALLWSYQGGAGVFWSVAVANGVVYVGTSGRLSALDASTGAVLWSDQMGQAWGSPAVANGVLYVTSYFGNVAALDASTGALLWGYGTDQYLESSLAVANGVVYVGAGDYMYAFGLPQGLVPQPPKRPDPKTLRPDFNLKISQPVASAD